MSPASEVIIEESKLRDYLLSIDHPVGGPKARFFLDHEFSRENPKELENPCVNTSSSEADISLH